MIALFLVPIGVGIFLFGYFTGRETAGSKYDPQITDLKAQVVYWQEMELRAKRNIPK
jgi:hypothetical protein